MQSTKLSVVSYLLVVIKGVLVVASVLAVSAAAAKGYFHCKLYKNHLLLLSQTNVKTTNPQRRKIPTFNNNRNNSASRNISNTTKISGIRWFLLFCNTKSIHSWRDETHLIYFGFELLRPGLCLHLQLVVCPYYLKRYPQWSVLFQCVGFPHLKGRLL